MKAGPPEIIFGGYVHIFNFTLLTPDATSLSKLVSSGAVSGILDNQRVRKKGLSGATAVVTPLIFLLSFRAFR